MTEAQRIAYTFPCWRARETVNPRFAAWVRFRGQNFSRVLSINK